MSDLLARFAESAFWLARYMERAENLARIIDVSESLSQESNRAEEWQPIVLINADAKRFFEKHAAATAEAVIDFYILDIDNPTSILSSVRVARENARMLRHLISTEMWTHINVFYNDLRELAPADMRVSQVSGMCSLVKEHCQTHTGITEGTMYRDQAWSFHELGKCLERADQATRLLDIKYHRLLPAPELVGSSIDAAQWNALLRSAAGYHAFRRVYPRGLSPSTVADFLLFNRQFPRSLMVSVARATELVGDLESRFGLDGGTAAAAIRTLRADLVASDIGAVIAGGLHEYLDSVQCRLIDITRDLGRQFFGQSEEEAEPPAQSQRQSG